MNDRLTIAFKPEKHKKLQEKQARGATLFWSWFNTITGRQDQAEQQILTLSRAVQVQRRRLDTLEAILSAISLKVRRGEAMIRFACISCSNSFEVLQGEAEALGLLELCPKCHGWAFPATVGKVYTSQQAAAELNLSASSIARKARENGLGRGWGGGNGTGSCLYFTEQEFQQLRDLPKGKPGGKPVKNGLSPHKQIT